MKTRKALGAKYRTLRRLAVGGMAEVWVAQNRATRAEVAIKTCRDELATAEAVLRFRHEARLGATLTHRGVVRVFDLIEERDGSLALVMELLRGETLERYLATKGPLPPGEAVAIALALLSALAHAHASGVIHRDVTPANVFLAVDPDGQVTPKLLDFGIAKAPADDRRTLEGRVLGTPRYMAPERIRAADAVDARSDLFSVAVILYELMTGACPFAAGSPAASLAAVLEDVVDPDPRIPPRLWFEIETALAKRPYERHPSAEDLARALRAAIDETDGALAQWLRRAPPGDAFPEGEGAPGSTQTVGGQSLGLSGAKRIAFGPKTVAWFAGIATALALVAALQAAARRPAATRRDAPLAAPPHPPPASGPSVEPPSSPLPLISLEPDSTQAPATSDAGTRSPAAPRRLARPNRHKPIATTPGF